jgi:chemotaxis protein CheD
MLNELMKRGARRDGLEAKVFGGASVLPGLASAQVGERNAEFVLRFLETESIPVVGRDLLGDCRLLLNNQCLQGGDDGWHHSP